mgnify:CR=1 FL=1
MIEVVAEARKRCKIRYKVAPAGARSSGVNNSPDSKAIDRIPRESVRTCASEMPFGVLKPKNEITKRAAKTKETRVLNIATKTDWCLVCLSSLKNKKSTTTTQKKFWVRQNPLLLVRRQLVLAVSYSKSCCSCQTVQRTAFHMNACGSRSMARTSTIFIISFSKPFFVRLCTK